MVCVRFHVKAVLVLAIPLGVGLMGRNRPDVKIESTGLQQITRRSVSPVRNALSQSYRRQDGIPRGNPDLSARFYMAACRNRSDVKMEAAHNATRLCLACLPARW